TVLYIGAALPIIGVMLFVTLRPVLVLPRIRPAPGFVLVDQQGQRVSNEDLRGQIVLYSFASTQCGAPCAPTQTLVSELASRLDEVESNIPITLVTISLDPEQDTPETVAAFVASQGIDPDRHRWLTGDPQQIRNVVGGGFKAYYSLDPDHTLHIDPTLMLVDGVGILRSEYRLQLPEVETLLRDISLLVEEANNSKGLTRYAYEAAHLFLCYP
ncbi:MAG: SCO family protein, partial [Caldilineae bacterium]